MKSKKVVEYFIKKGLFVTPDFLEIISDDFDPERFLEELSKEFGGKIPKVLSKEVYLKIKGRGESAIEKTAKITLKKEKDKFVISRLIQEKKVSGGAEISITQEVKYERKIKRKPEKVMSLTSFFGKEEAKSETKKVRPTKKERVEETKIEKDKKEEKKVIIVERKERAIGEEYDLSVEIIKNYSSEKFEEVSVSKWVSYFRTRYKTLRKFLKQHQELKSVISLEHLKKVSSEDVHVIGLVKEVNITFAGNIIITIEDLTGKAKVIVKKDSELYELAQNIIPDIVIGVIGRVREGVIFPDTILFPDIPIKEKKNAKEDVYVAFTGDLQVGSKAFLKEAWERFIDWIKGKNGNSKQKAIAKKIGYLIIPGDLVDGIGIYPSQEKELEILDIYKQYELFEKYILEIPEYIKIIIIPGNHDAVRLAEPQPPIGKEFLPELYKMDNVFLLSNPSYFNIHKTEESQGFTVLSYHGYSFDWLVSNLPMIRLNGGYDNPSLIMKYELMVRHLSPLHGESIYVPFSKEDPLIIDIVPDIFVSGHIHKTSVGNYRGVDLINASCWQGPTPYQIEMGHVPEPGNVIVKNLKTGKFNILKFYSG